MQASIKQHQAEALDFARISLAWHELPADQRWARRVVEPRDPVIKGSWYLEQWAWGPVPRDRITLNLADGPDNFLPSLS